MIIIGISNTKIKVTEKELFYIRERIYMNKNQEVLIRNKHDAQKLSHKTLRLLEEEHQKRFKEALKDGDMMYLNSVYNNISILGLIRLLLSKNRKYT